MELNKIYQGDCLELMKQIPDKSIDLVLTDPPYGIKADKMQMGSGNHQWDKTVSSWDNFIPSKEYFDEMFRVSKNQIIWGGNYFTEILKPSVDWLVWDKLNPNMSFSEAEFAWVRQGKRIRIFKFYSASQKKQHPTQKPIQLFKWCIDKFSKENDIILDPFIGSGTTAIACLKTNRNFIGMELEPKYVDIANKRIAEFKQQLALV